MVWPEFETGQQKQQPGSSGGAAVEAVQTTRTTETAQQTTETTAGRLFSTRDREETVPPAGSRSGLQWEQVLGLLGRDEGAGCGHEVGGQH